MSNPALVQARDGRSVRLAQFWRDVQARLSTVETLDILGGGRVFRATEDFGREIVSDGPWGRQVIVPAETMWPGVDVEPWYRGVSWLVRSEMNDFHGVLADGTPYDAAVPLERLQQIAYERLQAWVPTIALASDYMAVRPIWRQRPPQPMPEWDDDRKLWWMSSEFRAELTRRI